MAGGGRVEAVGREELRVFVEAGGGAPGRPRVAAVGGGPRVIGPGGGGAAAGIPGITIALAMNSCSAVPMVSPIASAMSGAFSPSRPADWTAPLAMLAISDPDGAGMPILSP